MCELVGRWRPFVRRQAFRAGVALSGPAFFAAPGLARLRKKKSRTDHGVPSPADHLRDRDLCGGLLTHPLKWSHREGEPWSGKLLRSRLARRRCPSFFPYSHSGFFPCTPLGCFSAPTCLLSRAARTRAEPRASTTAPVRTISVTGVSRLLLIFERTRPLCSSPCVPGVSGFATLLAS